MPQPKITIVKEFVYRGLPEQWSNTYHFSGGTPGDATAWRALGEAIIGLERSVLDNQTKFVKFYGYDPGAAAATYVKDYVADGLPVAVGAMSSGAGEFEPKGAGDQAATLRCFVRMSAKGKKVYVRKYYHVPRLSAADPDKLFLGYRNAVTALGASMVSGALPGGAKWCGLNGEVAQTPLTSPFVTTRTLKRRGRRPS